MADRNDFDVVVVGAGIAGLSAAIFAASNGLKVVVVEWSEKIGGTTACSFGGIWIANNEQARDGGFGDDPETALRYMEYVAGGQGNPDRIAAFLAAAPRALSLLCAAGLEVELDPIIGDSYTGLADGALASGRTLWALPFDGRALGEWRERIAVPVERVWRLPFMTLLGAPADQAAVLIADAEATDQLAQGPALIAHALQAALSLGVTILTEMRVAALLYEQGRVTGVRTQDGRTFSVQHGVVVATGGFEADIAMMESVEGLRGYRSVHPSTVVGDGMRLAGEIGGAFRIIHNNLGVLLGYDDPERTMSVDVSNSAIVFPHGFVVNRRGKRFGNEAKLQQNAATLRNYDAKARQLFNLPCWLVFDQQFVDRWGFGGAPGTVGAWVTRSDSLDGLAGALGIDAEGLIETAGRFAESAASGVDPEFGRGENMWAAAPAPGEGVNPSLGAVAEPPFYAVELHPTCLGASGLSAGVDAHVLDWEGRSIAGLYAAGNAAAHDEYGVGYQSGQSIASAMAFALLAVESMLEDHRTLA